jgi:hypothetical protein
MEAPKLKQLLKVANVVNPNWYPFISGYLNGQIPNLDIDNSDIEYGQELYMGNYDSCVVGEKFGFSGVYAHNGIDKCSVCERFADKLANFSNYFNSKHAEAQRTNFAITLESFYKHLGYMK